MQKIIANKEEYLEVRERLYVEQEIMNCLIKLKHTVSYRELVDSYIQEQEEKIIKLLDTWFEEKK